MELHHLKVTWDWLRQETVIDRNAPEVKTVIERNVVVEGHHADRSRLSTACPHADDEFHEGVIRFGRGNLFPARKANPQLQRPCYHTPHRGREPLRLLSR